MNNQNGIIQIDDDFCEMDTMQYAKSFMFIKGYAVGKELNQTLIALSVARRLHDGQYRKDGTPYICHPLKVCSTLISFRIDDDVTLAAALLHDVLEDCEDRLPHGAKELSETYGISDEVIHIVELLTKRSGLDDHELGLYFKKISRNPRASLIKLSDRMHNSSTVYNLSAVKMKKYLRETEIYLIPLGSYCKKYYPEYGEAFNVMKNSIASMNRIMKIMLEKQEKEKISPENADGDTQRVS